MHYLNYITGITLWILCLCSLNSQAQNCQYPLGKWQNDKGSFLEIHAIDSTGKIEGSYISHEGTEGQQFPLTGWWQTDSTQSGRHVLSMSVYWKPYQTITSWTGYCQTGENTLFTLWHHIDPSAKYDFQMWSSQSSEFKPLSK
jgi:hypothetical protein